MSNSSHEVIVNSISLSALDIFINNAVNERAIRAVDKVLTQYMLRHVSEDLTESEQIQLALFLCYLSHKMGQGDVCVRLQEQISTTFTFSYYQSMTHEFKALMDTLDKTGLIQLLLKSKLALVSQSDVLCLASLEALPEIPPIFVIADRVYFQRMWQDENIVSRYLVNQANQTSSTDRKVLKTILDEVFTIDDNDANKQHIILDIDRQKLAAAIALTKSISIISGGPGTGKTTTVAAILLSAIRLNPNKKLRILMAAPTGKAAARLTESLQGAQKRLKLTADERAQLSLEGVTLHRLLGASPIGDGFRFNKNNPLHCDFLVIDEASMIDLRLMAGLIDALTPSMKVILLGDRDQLASVAPGRVLGDICHFGSTTFNQAYATELAEILSIDADLLAEKNKTIRSTVGEVIGLLTYSRRFDSNSGIGKIAAAINKQDMTSLNELILANQGQYAVQTKRFSSEDNKVKFIDFAESEDYSAFECYEALLNDCLDGFTPYLKAVQGFSSEAHTPNSDEVLEDRHEKDISKQTLSSVNQMKDPVVKILTVFNQFRVLASIHSGIFGTDGLNEALINRFRQANLLKTSKDRHFEGRPILITRNDTRLNLFNGDVGVTLRDKDTGQLRVFFQNAKGELLSISPSRLPEHDTAFVMTVHKSQGSEFEHTLIVLPNEMNPVLTKELVYTAVTRAKEKLTIYSPIHIMKSAVKQITPRTSGLIDQISVFSETT